ncbi:MAG: endopeptidase La [Deltaproteobacteria bacterium]
MAIFNRGDEGQEEPRVHTLPLLPLRDIIVFPHMVVPLFVGREKSIAALEEAMGRDKTVVLAAQKKAKTNEPAFEDLFSVGTLATILQLLKLPDGTVKALVEGKRRVRLEALTPETRFYEVRAEEIDGTIARDVEVEALLRQVQATFESYVKLNKRIPPEMLASVATIDDPGRLADTIVAHLALKLQDKQAILETASPRARLEKLLELMQGEIEILQVERKIRTRVKKQMEKSQKEYYLNEQMQAIQKELGDRDEFKNEIQELEEKIRDKRMSKEATVRARKELKKLKMMSPMSAEATVVRNYIDWILALPWAEVTEDKLDVPAAEKILDEDHHGLRKVKERILEFLAVQSLVARIKGPILCLVGPPGVGKTSLARSIARAMGRRFVRISLGGVRDEAEVRGHRRTYIGAMPGKILQSIRKAGVSNPVVLLDEVDKMSTDFRGDPSAALLEVLDPEQNAAFVDHYLDLDYDLSNVVFVCTANTMAGIPLPLQDRMEVIRLAGYTDSEKLTIGTRYLVPRQREANGLADVDVDVKKAALKLLIHRYTREAGVRSLEREIASLLRKTAREVLKEGKERKYVIGAKRVQRLLGPPRFRHGTAEALDQVGLATGLAWTELGGELLTIEATVVPGKGKLTITGKLGSVMQESAQAAMSYVRSRAEVLGLEKRFLEQIDIHVHVPEGAIPKDGPSAGITMATALVSALTRVAVRKDIAMTGEITLRGRILPVGGVKEKVLAAHRGGIKTILLPRECEKDLREVPRKVREAMSLRLVDHMDEVLRDALVAPAREAFGRPAGEDAQPQA